MDQFPARWSVPNALSFFLTYPTNITHFFRKVPAQQRRDGGGYGATEVVSLESLQTGSDGLEFGAGGRPSRNQHDPGLPRPHPDLVRLPGGVEVRRLQMYRMSRSKRRGDAHLAVQQ